MSKLYTAAFAMAITLAPIAAQAGKYGWGDLF